MEDIEESIMIVNNFLKDLDKIREIIKAKEKSTKRNRA